MNTNYHLIVFTRFALNALTIILFLSPALSFGSQASPDSANPSSLTVNETLKSPPEAESKRIFWIIPNYRTSPSFKDYKPITPRQKLKIATEDSADRGTVALAAAFGGRDRLANATPSFGHGAKATARYFGASYADFAVGNFMTEAVYPAILHQDPRYFRRGEGSGWSRFRYAVGQIFWTHTDSGNMQFNFSEIVGNSTAVAISTAYYPDNRDLQSAANKLAIQIGVDTAANILKEFWPDLHRKLTRKHGPAKPSGAVQGQGFNCSSKSFAL